MKLGIIDNHKFNMKLGFQTTLADLIDSFTLKQTYKELSFVKKSETDVDNNNILTLTFKCHNANQTQEFVLVLEQVITPEHSFKVRTYLTQLTPFKHRRTFVEGSWVSPD